jgi:hypothetical protein
MLVLLLIKKANVLFLFIISKLTEIYNGKVYRYFGVRVLAILVTWEVMVAITLLHVVETWISDEELQIWCKRCVFGNLFRGAHFCYQLT